MKPTILYVLTAFVLFTSLSPSQSFVPRFGFKVAMTSADQEFHYTYLPSNETKRRLGFGVAGYVEWFDSPVSLVTQLEYIQKGMAQEFAITIDDPTPIAITDFYGRLDYISFPILARFSLPQESIRPFLVIGPRVDFLVNYGSDEDVWDGLYHDFKKTTYGATFGAGAEIDHFSPVPATFEIRYNIDLVDSYSTEFLKVKNNAFDFWLGIKL